MLIDDVITTGSTINECVATLVGAGAYRVQAFALAKALLDEDLGEDFSDVKESFTKGTSKFPQSGAAVPYGWRRRVVV